MHVCACCFLNIVSSCCLLKSKLLCYMQHGISRWRPGQETVLANFLTNGPILGGATGHELLHMWLTNRDRRKPPVLGSTFFGRLVHFSFRFSLFCVSCTSTIFGSLVFNLQSTHSQFTQGLTHTHKCLCCVAHWVKVTLRARHTENCFPFVKTDYNA